MERIGPGCGLQDGALEGESQHRVTPAHVRKSFRQNITSQMRRFQLAEDISSQRGDFSSQHSRRLAGGCPALQGRSGDTRLAERISEKSSQWISDCLLRPPPRTHNGTSVCLPQTAAPPTTQPWLLQHWVASSMSWRNTPQQRGSCGHPQ